MLVGACSALISVVVGLRRLSAVNTIYMIKLVAVVELGILATSVDDA